MRLSLFFILVGLALPASAQTNTEAFLEQATTAVGTTSSRVTGTTLLSAGETAAATVAAFPSLAPGVNAVAFSQDGSDNTLDAQQTGLDNRIVVSQTGSDNTTTASQNGNRNQLVATIQGDDNALTAVQTGDDNTYGLVMSGSELQHQIRQTGQGNTATQFVAPGLLPASIEQRGNGLEVVVERF